MSSSPTMPMISPDGQIGDVPLERIGDAVKSNFKLGQDMLSPDGKTGTIPVEKVHDAIRAGFQLKPPTVQKPKTDMQPSNIGIALDQSESVRNPQQPAESFAIENPEQQETLATAAGIGAGGAGVTELAAATLPKAIPATIAGAKAVTAWAGKNPVQAYLLLQLLKEVIPGAKKAIGIVKGTPE